MTNPKPSACQPSLVEVPEAPLISPTPAGGMAAELGRSIAKPLAELEQMRVDLEAAQAQAAEHLATLQRTIADFANYRRRTAEEREAEGQNAAEDLLRQLLPLLDDFERAASARPAELTDSAWADGVTVIERKLRAVLEASGVSTMDTRGAAFDPRRHEAIGTLPAAPEFEGAVVAETGHGYLRGERVLRPAQVMVGVLIIGDHQETD
jgi:molecular chaperone GrpE